MKINHPSEVVEGLVDEVRSGVRSSRIFLTGEEGAPDNYRLGCNLDGGSRENWTDWTSPRHHHHFEQIRYPIKGDYSIGTNEVLPAGWVAYFPESCYYGPQVKSPNLTMLVLQFGGPSGLGYYSVEERHRAYSELLGKGGTFEGGMYCWVDEDGNRHNQDPHQALYRQLHGKDLIYPNQRYDSIILMNPENFSWMKDEMAPGVARKQLGSFSERDIRIGFVHMDAGSALRFGTEPSSEILFVKEGAISHADRSYGSFSAFGTTPRDVPEMLVATEESELFYIKLPTF